MFEQGALITLAIAALGVAFQLGRHSQRIAHLEEWREETRAWHLENLKALEAIRDEIRELRP